MTAQTSDRVSSIAARLAKLTPDTLLALTATAPSREALTADIRSLAASALRQDEHRGLRGIIKRITGR